MLDWVFATVVGFLITAGGCMGMVKKHSIPSLVAGCGFGALYLAAAYMMLFPPGLRKPRVGDSKNPAYQNAKARGRRRANVFAAFVSLALTATFLVRWQFFGAPTGMSLGVAALGLVSFALHTALSRS
uniref:DUF2178 domain-containing protein n=1 Tax=Neobodo designis TaxID=312471 RepID=A0A7S1M8N8_NEODS|mmetsp:Transcript_3625/g.11355  ORF Transcript_3625/g.11355 Transcript_3625/m.11355 type:complete len:128 (+) Transcript_3625:68-451(+)